MAPPAKKQPPTELPRHERASRRLVDLQPHPRQGEWFAPLSKPELQQLAESMDLHRLQHPIHITPTNVILAGHQRVAAARLLGWTTIDVIVRHDLAADETGAAMFVLTDNLHRRQMGPLELAAAYQALREVEHQAQPCQRSGEYRRPERVDLRDRLALHFGKSGRQLDRYLRLLELPIPVRQAISARRLPVSLAEQLFLIDQQKREEAAELIAAGQVPKAVVRRFSPGRLKSPRLPRPERPGAAAVKAELCAMLHVFTSEHFDRYREFIELQGGDCSASVAMLQRAKEAAEGMRKRIGKYLDAARQLA